MFRVRYAEFAMQIRGGSSVVLLSSVLLSLQSYSSCCCHSLAMVGVLTTKARRTRGLWNRSLPSGLVCATMISCHRNFSTLWGGAASQRRVARLFGSYVLKGTLVARITVSYVPMILKGVTGVYPEFPRCCTRVWSVSPPRRLLPR